MPNPRCDLIVIGASAAGVAAALEAAAHGLRVVLLDEADQPDARLQSASVERRCAEPVWSVSGAFRVDTLGPDGPLHYQAPAVVVADGPEERAVAFAGCTLPGVFSLLATARGLKSHRALPGRRILLAGCGPLLTSVGAGILDRGGEVAAIIDLASRRDWVGCLPALAWHPAELLRAIGWSARLRSGGVPILHRATLTEVVAAAQGLHVSVGCVDGAGRLLSHAKRWRFAVDAVVVGYGLTPATDITRLLRAEHAYDAVRGFWHPVVDHFGRSSIKGLYVAGEVGLVGAGEATLSGRIAGLAAARDMGRISPAAHAQLMAPLRRRAASAARVSRAIGAMGAPRPGLTEAISAETVVCRCEHVTRADIDGAVVSGATNLNQLKAWTRCGMGACQGRACADTAAALLSAHGIAPEVAGYFTGRTPLRPLPLALLTGDYGYGDIVLPPPAPP